MLTLYVLRLLWELLVRSAFYKPYILLLMYVLAFSTDADVKAFAACDFFSQ